MCPLFCYITTCPYLMPSSSLSTNTRCHYPFSWLQLMHLQSGAVCRRWKRAAAVEGESYLSTSPPYSPDVADVVVDRYISRPLALSFTTSPALRLPLLIDKAPNWNTATTMADSFRVPYPYTQVATDLHWQVSSSSSSSSSNTLPIK